MKDPGYPAFSPANVTMPLSRSRWQLMNLCHSSLYVTTGYLFLRFPVLLRLQTAERNFFASIDTGWPAAANSFATLVGVISSWDMFFITCSNRFSSVTLAGWLLASTGARRALAVLVQVPTLWTSRLVTKAESLSLTCPTYLYCVAFLPVQVWHSMHLPTVVLIFPLLDAYGWQKRPTFSPFDVLNRAMASWIFKPSGQLKCPNWTQTRRGLDTFSSCSSLPGAATIGCAPAEEDIKPFLMHVQCLYIMRGCWLTLPSLYIGQMLLVSCSVSGQITIDGLSPGVHRLSATIYHSVMSLLLWSSWLPSWGCNK